MTKAKEINTNIETMQITEPTPRVIPRMLSIQEVMELTGFSYRHLWTLCKLNKIIHIRTGSKYLINFDKFIDYLNTGDPDKPEVMYQNQKKEKKS